MCVYMWTGIGPLCCGGTGLPRHFHMPHLGTCQFILHAHMQTLTWCPLLYCSLKSSGLWNEELLGVSSSPLLQNGSVFVWLCLCLCGTGKEGLWHVTHARAAMATDGTWELSDQGMYMSCSPVEPVKCHFRRAGEI